RPSRPPSTPPPLADEAGAGSPRVHSASAGTSRSVPPKVNRSRHHQAMVISRRQLLKGSASGLGLLVAGQAGMLRLATPAFGTPPGTGAFGALRPDPDGIIDLPPGFRYDIVARAGQPLAGSDGVGGLTPGRPDGTAAFAGILAKTYLVQNHEQGTSAAFPARADARFTYDAGALGGTTTLRLDNRNRLEEQYVSLAGTFNNCAGGPTPWGTWLTCEETEVRAGGVLTK